MKLIRIVILALFTVSCSRDTPERTDHKSEDPGPSVATSGETRQPTVTPEPATQPNQGEKPVAAPTPVAERAKATGVNPDAAVLADFKSRIDAYMKLRKEAVKDAPRLKETDGPGQDPRRSGRHVHSDSRGACDCETRRHLHAGNHREVPPAACLPS